MDEDNDDNLRAIHESCDRIEASCDRILSDCDHIIEAIAQLRRDHERTQSKREMRKPPPGMGFV